MSVVLAALQMRARLEQHRAVLVAVELAAQGSAQAVPVLLENMVVVLAVAEHRQAPLAQVVVRRRRFLVLELRLWLRAVAVVPVSPIKGLVALAGQHALLQQMLGL
jgi:hypothetical protein